MDRIEKEIENELLNLSQMNKIHAELDNLKENLNSCIDLVSESANSPSLNNRLDEMKAKNSQAYKEANADLEEKIENSKQTLYDLSIKKEQEEEKEEEEEEEEEEEVNDN